MAGHGPVPDVPSEDLAERVLVRARHVRGGRLRVEFLAAQLAPADHPFLLVDRQGLPGGGVVLPLLEQQHAAAGAGLIGIDDGRRRRLDEGRVLGAVLEPGQVAVAVVGPADELVARAWRTGRAPR